MAKGYGGRKVNRAEWSVGSEKEVSQCTLGGGQIQRQNSEGFGLALPAVRQRERRQKIARHFPE